jgi:hypothetical protein
MTAMQAAVSGHASSGFWSDCVGLKERDIAVILHDQSVHTRLCIPLRLSQGVVVNLGNRTTVVSWSTWQRFRMYDADNDFGLPEQRRNCIVS